MGFSHPLELPRYILDPIHGAVRLRDIEIEILNSRVFGRLRRIKQNGLLYLIFPSASHSRFEHSLGVLHLSDLVLQSLVHNSVAASEKHRTRVLPLSRAQDGDAIQFQRVLRDNPDEGQFLFEVTRYAALIHDLGHGPLSHAFEGTFSPSVADVESLLDCEELEPVAQEVRAHFSDKGKLDDTAVDHEVISCLLFSYVWSNIDHDDYPESEWDSKVPAAVTAAILGGNIWEDVNIRENLRRWLPLVTDIVASAPADADRMDYLERDSRNMGVTYGLYDQNRVLKSFVCYVSEDGASRHFRLGVKSSGVRAIENFIQARFQLFAQVYHHKTNRAILSAMRLIGCIVEKDSGSLRLIPSESVEDFVDKYVELDDHHFIRHLRGMAGGPLEDKPRINQIAEQLFRRRLWKRVRDCAGREEAECLREALEREFPDHAFWVDQVEPKATKGLRSGAALLEKGSGGVYKVGEERNWADPEVSAIINTLEQEEASIVRVYLQRDSIDQELTERAEKVRDRAGSLVETKEACEDRPMDGGQA